VARALLAEAHKSNMTAVAMIADGKVPQPTGGSEELGPQRLHVSWGTDLREMQDSRRRAAPATTPEHAKIG